MGTHVYIDGFNLYNGAVKGTPHKWLDIEALSNRLLPKSTISCVRYFTATVKGHPRDPDAPNRQNIYVRALRTLRTVAIHKEGWFSTHPIVLPQFPLAYPFGDKTRKPYRLQVQKSEEKRTDVDLATHLLVDCFDDAFDEAVVISNDSDLVLPIEIVRDRFNKRIGVINPHPPSKMSGHLIKASSFHLRTINKSALAACQLPPTLTDATGTITKPTSW